MSAYESSMFALEKEKNMTICANCGTALPDGARFCDECGAPVAVQQAQPAVSQQAYPQQPAQQATSQPQLQQIYQVPMPQPYPPQQMPAPYPQQPNPPKGNSKAPIIIGIAVAVIVIAIAAVMFFLDPLKMFHKEDPNRNGNASNTVQVDNGNNANSQTSGNAQPAENAENKPSNNASSSSASANAEAKPSNTQPQAQPSGEEKAKALSTTERPAPADFAWATSEMRIQGTPPADKAKITDFKSACGSWKGYIIYNPASPNIEYYLTLSLGGVPDAAALGATWHYTVTSATGEQRDSTDPDTMFNGKWNNGTVDAIGAGHLQINAFWEDGGKQYGIGTMMLPDGTQGTLLLTRP